MLKWVRVFAGVLLGAFFLGLAVLATRDCTADIYTRDNCLWLWLREQSGLPQSRLLRAVALELVGLTLAAGLYLAFRYTLLPMRKSRSAPSGSEAAREDSDSA